MEENKHEQSIPADVLVQVQTKANEIKALLHPYVTVLSAKTRRERAIMGEKSLGFVEKAYEYAKKNPQFVPPCLDIDAFTVDFTDAHGLWPLVKEFQQIVESLSDTHMTARIEAYQAALTFYNYMKMTATQTAPGASTIYKDLKIRFTKVKSKPTETASSGTEQSNAT
jgi:hypothetical protein